MRRMLGARSPGAVAVLAATVLAATVLAATVLSGCATSAGDRTGDDEETSVGSIIGEWQLTKGSDADGGWRINGTPVTLVIADDSVAGQGPCNGFGGDVEVDGSAITIGSIVSTKMACTDDARTRLETRYFAALENVTTAELGGTADLSTLTLSGPDETLKFTIVAKKTAN